MGVSALQNTTGSGNVAVGNNAGSNLTTGSDNIDIGAPGVAGEANTIRIGKSGTQQKALLPGFQARPWRAVLVSLSIPVFSLERCSPRRGSRITSKRWTK
jgi:hypothetical protein